ncbi:hypothetical protein [Candidatus Magnetaquicoccus inordinatus]|uniref:hypothetical protein n=1 Tax=Candidatus Magnetaquicoccus inordinatus TaxID=2496818 RepID=UPI00102AD370|nr:hypothetical protein [Candidatus Magnetaquicoccus inordinatus]
MSQFVVPYRVSLLLFLLALLLAPQPLRSDTAKAIHELQNSNQAILASPWTTLLPAQPAGSGFTLSKNGQLAIKGQAITPQIQVHNGDGKKQLAPISVNISPVSPSKRFALLTACEPPADGSSMCWFQYLLDLKQHRLHELTWAKYPTPTTVWWQAQERFSVLPVGDEGDIWLAVIDLEKKESRDVQFYDFALESASSLACSLPEQDGYTLDLRTLQWLDNKKLSINLVLSCGSEKSTLRTVKTIVDLSTGELQRATEAGKASGKMPADPVAKGQSANIKSEKEPAR